MENENKPTFLPSQEETASPKGNETPAVKKAEEIEEKIKNVANIDDESLLIEDDGDFFWVLQRVVWGILKTTVVLGLLLFLGWSIWGKEISLWKKKDILKQPTSPIIITTTTPLKTDGSYIFEIAQKAFFLEKARISKQSNIIIDAVIWLKTAKSLGEISTVVLRIQSPETRAQKIEETLVALDKSFEESKKIQGKLRQQGEKALLKFEQENRIIEALNTQIESEIQHLQPQNITTLLSQKIEAQKRAVEFGSQGKLLKTLFLNIQNFDQLLRSLSVPMANPITELKNQ